MERLSFRIRSIITKLSWITSQYKDMVVTDDVLAKGFYMVDDYPEEALTLKS